MSENHKAPKDVDPRVKPEDDGTAKPPQALERIRALARPLPIDWTFDRDEANSRSE